MYYTIAGLVKTVIFNPSGKIFLEIKINTNQSSAPVPQFPTHAKKVLPPKSAALRFPNHIKQFAMAMKSNAVLVTPSSIFHASSGESIRKGLYYYFYLFRKLISCWNS
jgi:hypothetical protein